MGHDANIKSSQAERRLRQVLYLSLITLSLSIFVIMSLLQKDAVSSSVKINTSRVRNKNKESSLPHTATDHNRANLHAEMTKRVAHLDEAVRAIKKTDVIMETDKDALKMTALLQDATRQLIQLRYGQIADPAKNYRVRLELEFQKSIPDFEEKGREGSVLIELAPIDLVPCSVFNFLEMARTWKGGAFHRNANHVLQAKAHSDVKLPMPFQEYSDKYPHVKGTVGYAGRPSGPAFYISIMDNSKNHGPGSQQKRNPYEADCIIGTVIKGMDDVVPRIHTMPFNGFNKDSTNWVLIRRMQILVPGDGGETDNDGYIEFSTSPLEVA